MAIYEGVWGEMHVEYDVFKTAMDVTPYLKGLPNDRDPCPHWGIVVKGQMKIIYDGKQEIAKAGEAYYFPPITLLWRMQALKFGSLALTISCRKQWKSSTATWKR